MLTRILCLALPLSLSGHADPLAPSTFGEGAWTGDAAGKTLSQCRPAGDGWAVLRLPDGGSAWRCLVEPGPYLGPAGIRIACGEDGRGGLELSVAADPGHGIVLRTPVSDDRLWQDPYLDVPMYSPVWLEAVCETGRVRVQCLAVDGQSLLAQSAWIPLPQGLSLADPHMAVFTRQATARFAGWTRAAAALAEWTPDNPTALRLQQDAQAAWEIVGGGAWQWEDSSRRAIRQTRGVERTTAFREPPMASEGTWRCSVRLDKGTCGGGMLVHANAELSEGFLVWLGGTYGNGSLILYRYPIQHLWASPNGLWKWDTDYTLEAVVQDGAIQARLLDGDGLVPLAASPKVALAPHEVGRGGRQGFQTWRGTGRFVLAAPERVGDRDASSAPASVLGPDWLVRSGEWSWIQPGKVLRQSSGKGDALALTQAVAGARGCFRCAVVVEGAAAVGFLFQLAEAGAQGFECRLDRRFSLRGVDGTVLWESVELALPGGERLAMEGIVRTDRVQARLLGADGRVLAESVERYVSDTNNTRIGGIGMRSIDGAAVFSDWSWREEAP